MARARPHPEDRLLNSAQCAERLGIHESDWWEVLKRPDAEVLRRGQRCLKARTVRWKAQALADFIDALPTKPTYRPPASGRLARAVGESTNAA